jgi:hypothetical protein
VTIACAASPFATTAFHSGEIQFLANSGEESSVGVSVGASRAALGLGLLESP